MRALAPTLVTAPENPLLSVAEARAHLRVTSTSEDDYIEALVDAATSHIDGYAGVLGRALLTQTWRQSFNDFPPVDEIRIALGPVQSVVVTYYDPSDNEQTLASGDYHVVASASGPKIILRDGYSWPSTSDRPDAATIEWVCGYGDTSAGVPAGIIHAAKLLVGHWFHNREAASEASMSEVPLAVSALLAPYRTIGV
jgi:uncharacterized phiE125 gp8 family phage protein